MNHILPNTVPLREHSRSAPGRGDRGRRTSTELGALYDRHAHPLYELAHLLCQDTSAADDVFVVAMSRLGNLPGAAEEDPRAQRRHLAAGLWRAACTPLASEPRAATRPPAVQPLPTRPPAPREALLGLTLLGGHTYQEAANLIGLTPAVAARQLRAALLIERTERGAPPVA
ncbi:hypothetical protein [Streptomyces sp. MBT27]|uniref:hypothetical protein n=1 Tax=Streptomyces sp. MBT27 TaxID=1488356 RepID=UPI0014243654|nr:hypothetical protein [Streptomyces sp. MBT27]